MAKKHTHKYFYGHKVGSTTVWRCAIPKCSHYLPEHMEEHIIGRAGICWSCGEEMVLDGDKDKPKPMCPGCELIDKANAEKITERYTQIAERVSEPKTEVPSEPITDPMCAKCRKVPHRFKSLRSNDMLCITCWSAEN